jgi:hypothetical protein
MKSGIATRIVLWNSPQGRPIGSTVLIRGTTRKRLAVNHRGRNSLIARPIPDAIVAILRVNASGNVLAYIFCPGCESFGRLGNGYLLHYTGCKNNIIGLIYKDMEDEKPRLILSGTREHMRGVPGTVRASGVARGK